MEEFYYLLSIGVILLTKITGHDESWNNRRNGKWQNYCL